MSSVGVAGTLSRDGRGKPRRHRFGLLFLLSLAVGGAAGIFAFAIIWMPTLFGVFHDTSTQPQIEASMLFPSPAPIQNTVNIYDPPVYVAPAPRGGGGGDDGGGGGGDN